MIYSKHTGSSTLEPELTYLMRETTEGRTLPELCNLPLDGTLDFITGLPSGQYFFDELIPVCELSAGRTRFRFK